MGSNTKGSTTRAASGSLRTRIVEATEAHCFEVGEDVHPEGAAELRHGLGAGMSLGDCLNYGRLRYPGTLAGLVDGRAEAIFGCYWSRSGVGVPWFIGTNRLMERPLLVTRVGRRVVERWRSQFGRLENMVPAGFRSVRWLTLMGFDILPAEVAQCADGERVLYHRFRSW
jgi:hypothetical protein